MVAESEGCGLEETQDRAYDCGTSAVSSVRWKQPWRLAGVLGGCVGALGGCVGVWVCLAGVRVCLVGVWVRLGVWVCLVGVWGCGCAWRVCGCAWWVRLAGAGASSCLPSHLPWKGFVLRCAVDAFFFEA